jgi:hypothetical protein
MLKLADHPVWRGLGDADRQLLLRAARLLLKKGSAEVRAPRLIEEVPPREWLIEELLPAQSVVAVIGPTNQGKTWISQVIACLVASPEGVAGSFDGRAVRRHGPVWYFTSEDPQGLGTRRKAWERENCPVPGLFLFDDVPLLTGPLAESVRFLRSASELTACSPVLLVIDVFTDAVSGDDNAAEVIAPAMRQARALGRMFGAAVLLVHHSNKGDPKDPRGSSAFGNATDVTAAVIADATGIHMTWVKARATPKGSDFHFHIHNGVLRNGSSAKMGGVRTFSEGDMLARVAGRVLREIQAPATLSDWNAAIIQAAPSCFSGKMTSECRRTKLSRARRTAVDRRYAVVHKNKVTIGPEAVPDDAIEPGNLEDLLPVAGSEDLK